MDRLIKKGIPLFVFIFFVVFTACKKNNTPSLILNEMADSTSVPQSVGTFNNGPYGSVSGEAKIILTDNRYELKLMNLNSNNGPDLRVYLSKEMFPVTVSIFRGSIFCMDFNFHRMVKM